MQALVVAALALAWTGCRSDDANITYDLSAASLFCPAEPPTANDFVCDPTAIPYCTYPTQQLTCTCMLVDRGRHVLVCPPDMGVSDGGGDHAG
jgi:hypothetical protein